MSCLIVCSVLTSTDTMGVCNVNVSFSAFSPQQTMQKPFPTFEAPPSVNYSPPCDLKFYPGGQFTPEGGRSPCGQRKKELQLLQQALQQQGSSFPSFGAPPYTSYSSLLAPSSQCSPPTPPSNSDLKFYKGGQFTPGGGRAPRRGCWMSPSSGSSLRSSPSTSSSSGGGTFYKGGQFTPGGGRAPKGGCWK